MHLSHLYLDLASWYGKVLRRPGRPHVLADDGRARPARDALQRAGGVATLGQVKADAPPGKAGHNSALQTATRLANDVIDNYGRLPTEGHRRAGARGLQHARRPVHWYSTPTARCSTRRPTSPGCISRSSCPAATLSHRRAAAMDGVLPDGTTCARSSRPERADRHQLGDDAPRTGRTCRPAAGPPLVPARRAAMSSASALCLHPVDLSGGHSVGVDGLMHRHVQDVIVRARLAERVQVVCLRMHHRVRRPAYHSSSLYK